MRFTLFQIEDYIRCFNEDMVCEKIGTSLLFIYMFLGVLSSLFLLIVSVLKGFQRVLISRHKIQSSPSAVIRCNYRQKDFSFRFDRLLQSLEAVRASHKPNWIINNLRDGQHKSNICDRLY